MACLISVRSCPLRRIRRPATSILSSTSLFTPVYGPCRPLLSPPFSVHIAQRAVRAAGEGDENAAAAVADTRFVDFAGADWVDAPRVTGNVSLHKFVRINAKGREGGRLELLNDA